MNGLQRLDATVHGTVQGVGFRWFVRRQALQFALTGWVANESDGSVRVVAEGSREGLEQLLVQLRIGPNGAAVSSVDNQWLPASGAFAQFEIRSGGHTGD